MLSRGLRLIQVQMIPVANGGVHWPTLSLQAHNMDFVPRLSHFSVEVALLEMVRCSPTSQLADSLFSTSLGSAVAAPFNRSASGTWWWGGKTEGRGTSAAAAEDTNAEVPGAWSWPGLHGQNMLV